MNKSDVRGPLRQELPLANKWTDSRTKDSTNVFTSSIVHRHHSFNTWEIERKIIAVLKKAGILFYFSKQEMLCTQNIFQWGDLGVIFKNGNSVTLENRPIDRWIKANQTTNERGMTLNTQNMHLNYEPVSEHRAGFPWNPHTKSTLTSTTQLKGWDGRKGKNKRPKEREGPEDQVNMWD